MFEVKYRDGMGRLGELHTPHGVIETPTLLPVVNPKKLTLSVDELEECGATALITNSYLIWKEEEFRERATKEGVHGLLDWDKPIMTDSGTFQAYMYGEVEVLPEEIIEFQKKIGTDIGTMLDVFTIPKTNFSDAEKELEETDKRMKVAAEMKGEMALNGTIQGGLHMDLRSRAAKMASEIDVDVHPIGGVVPLMEKYEFSSLVDVVMNVKMNLIASRPVHLFGCGHPMLFPLAALMGCDLFDSASYAKFAADDRLMFPWGTRKLADLNEMPSCSLASTGLTINEIKKMEDKERVHILAKHNLLTSFSEIRRVKQAIWEGSLWELVELRSHCHPNLMKAMEKLRVYREYLSKYEPMFRKRGFSVVSEKSPDRPIVHLISKRIPKSDECFVHPLFGSTPHSLSQTQPVAQLPNFEGGRTMEWNEERIVEVIDFQFGKGLGKKILGKNIECIFSEKTGRLRNINRNGRHILSLRPREGRFTLKKEGAIELHKQTKYPSNRVVVEEETAEFNKEGKSVFCQFVLDIDKDLRPMDECLIVTEKDELVAFGQLRVSPCEIEQKQRGYAVRVSEGV